MASKAAFAERGCALFERILVPLDTSQDAGQVLPYVQTFAKQLRVPVVLLAVIPDLGELNPVGSFYDAELAQLTEFRRHRAEEYLQSVCEQFRSDGIQTTSVVEVGAIDDRIIATAEAQRADLIAMATHGRVGPARLVLGSIADKVVRTSTVPVLLIRPREGSAAPERIEQVLLPLDGSEQAERAIPYATFLARAFKIPVTAIRDVPMTWIAGADPMGMSGAGPQVVQAIEDEAQQYIRAVATRLRGEGLVAQAHFGAFSAPAADIVSLAEETPGALVVMTSHGRSGLRRTILGSVTDRVIRSSAAPVLVVPGLADASGPAGG